MDPNRPVSSGRPGSARWLAWTAAVAAYSLVTLIYLRPIWRVGGDCLAPSLADPLFNLYVLKWGVHQLQLGLPDLWNANLFYPTPGTFTLSDHLIGPAAQLVLFLRVVPNAIAGYNFLLFTAFVGTALAVCWVCRRTGLSWPAALLAGWMYTFSPFRLAQMAHLQLLIVQWAPLTLWLWDRLLAERTVRNAALFLVFYLLHVTGGCYLAYMIHVPLLAIFLSRAWGQGREILSLHSLRVLVPVGLIAAIAVAALFLPYRKVSRSLGLARTQEEIWDLGATPASYLSPARESLYFGPGVRNSLRRAGLPLEALYKPERVLFAGFLPTSLFLVGAVGRWRRRREDPWSPWERGLTLSGLLCFALTFPWVYAPLMRVVPGMNGMRVPARFYAFVSLTLVVFAGMGIDLLRAKLSRPSARAVLVGLLGAGLVVELAPQPLRWRPLEREEEFPAVYRWIAREPSVRALIELPIHSDTRENEYIYYSTLYWKPLANGYSGYMPPEHERLAGTIHFVPEQDGLDLLREMRISHLVIHAETPRRVAVLRDWDARFALGWERQVERVYQEDDTWVYRLLPPLTSSRNPKRAGL
ncbi:MAG TPA: hypothetical protein VGP73_24015 [Thermoanaerobaculia bacterium]